MNKKTYLIFFAAVIALLAGISFQIIQSGQKTSLAQEKVDFRFPDVEGVMHDMNDWHGYIRIVNFWATWCPPCLKEIPEFIALQTQLNDKKVKFIGIAIEDRDSVQQYLASIDMNYPILIGGDQAISLSYQLGNIINAVPYTVFVNPDGQVFYRHPGEISSEKILEILESESVQP